MARQRRKIQGVVAAAVVFASITASAQQCYYPNGEPSPNDSPCSLDGGACCPVDWQCLDNGLCFLEQFSYYERHSCTDKAWGSSCPDICTGNGTAIGNEAILNCGGDEWCCDWDRQQGNCCSKPATSFVTPPGNAFALVTSMGGAPSTLDNMPAKTTHSDASTSTSTTTSTDPTSSSIASSTTTSTATTSSTPSSTSQTSSTGASSTPSSTTQSTSASAQASASATGAFSFDPSTSDSSLATSTSPPTGSLTPSPTWTPAAASASTRPLGTILGISLGIPFAILAIGFAIWTLYQRRRSRYKQNHPEMFQPATSDMPGMYAHLPPDNPYKDGRMPEADGHPVVPTKHLLSELDGSTPPRFNAAAYNRLPADSPPSSGKVSSISPMTTSNNRWSDVSSLRGGGHASPTNPQGLGLGFPRSSGAGGLHDVPEEAGLGPYAPYRAYRPPLVELAGDEVLPRPPPSQPAPGERTREQVPGIADGAADGHAHMARQS